MQTCSTRQPLFAFSTRHPLFFFVVSDGPILHSWSLQLHTAGWQKMVILSIDDYIASSILLLLTPNIKDCRYDHVIDSSTIPTATHVLLSHHENILLAGVLPISITNYVINRKTIHVMICYYHRNVNMDQYLSYTMPKLDMTQFVGSIEEKSLQLLSLWIRLWALEIANRRLYHSIQREI